MQPRSSTIHTLAQATAVLGIALATLAAGAQQHRDHEDAAHFWPGNLVVSRSVYDNNPANVKVGTILPPNCASTQGGCAASTGAPFNGLYPFVFNNDTFDSSFGITSRIFLDQITPTGSLLNTLEVPNSLQRGINSKSDQLVTSFSSKSEVALHLSTDRRYLTFMGYVAAVDTLDVSNSNTPAAVDPTNPVGQNFLRGVAQVDAKGRFQFTETNAYSGNNGRAVILNNTHDAGDPIYYTAGNAGNGANPQPDGIILGAGAQILDALDSAERKQDPGTPTPVASFSVTELGDKADKIGKDDNFRGMTVFHNVLYYTKGSGSNGVNTVYFVDTTGKACPKGVGLPSPGATLPTTALVFNPADLQTTGLPNNMCILAGFPTTLAKTANPLSFPFGIWFADANTLYVSDEGDGFAGGADLYTHAAAQTTAGLQKWVFNAGTQSWSRAYTLQANLNLGVPYTVPGYPTGPNATTGLPWQPATDGLRNFVGHVNRDGTVTLWAVTSTISGGGDTGADPNRLVVVTDALRNTDPAVAAHENFSELRRAGFAEVLRGVSFTPEAENGRSDR
jgi:hypothetical protein